MRDHSITVSRAVMRRACDARGRARRRRRRARAAPMADAESPRRDVIGWSDVSGAASYPGGAVASRNSRIFASIAALYVLNHSRWLTRGGLNPSTRGPSSPNPRTLQWKCWADQQSSPAHSQHHDQQQPQLARPKPIHGSRLSRAITERVAPIVRVAEEAAASDPELAAMMKVVKAARQHEMIASAQMLAGPDGLRGNHGGGRRDPLCARTARKSQTC